MNYFWQYAAGFAVCAAAGYLLGSICFAIIATRLFAKKDIRTMGSGNAGMTNVLRSVGAPAAAVTLVLDVGKAVAAVLLGRFLFALITGAEGFYGGYIAGIFVIIGHIYPVWFGFRGGKGVLTAAGMMLALYPSVFGFAFSVFLIVFVFTRIVSISSICAAVSLPIITYVWTSLHYGDGLWFKTSCTIIIALLIVFMHRANILRLLKGTEKKFSIATPHSKDQKSDSN